jgi:hypothetical protein
VKAVLSRPAVANGVAKEIVDDSFFFRTSGILRAIFCVPKRQRAIYIGFCVGLDRACKVPALVRLGFTLQARAFEGLAWPGLEGKLGVWSAGLGQKPGPHGLGLLVYVVKAQAQACGLGPGPDPALFLCR